ncbi:MAG: hypothetical protein MI723_11995, partial [Caulobacterales bacterium]|nr:hypothetical protein [Caulobacterales bacterium]
MVTRRAFKACWLCLEGLAVVLAIAGILAATAAWRLSRGPVSLQFWQADMERALAAAFRGDEVALGEAFIAWSAREQSLVVVLTEVRVTGEDGRVLAEAPRIEAGLSGPPLLTGRVAFSHLGAEGGVFSIVRDEAGRLAAGLGPPEKVASEVSAAGGGRPGGDWRALLARLGGPGGAGGSLRQLSLEGATLHLHDALTGVAWRADDARLALRRDGAGVRATARGDIVAPETAGEVRIDARLGADLSDARIDVDLVGAVPAALAPPSGSLAMLARLDAPTDVSATLTLQDGAGLAAADVTLQAGAGQVRVGETAETLTGARVRATYEPASDSIVIAEGRVEAETSRVDVMGRVDGLRAHLMGESAEPVRFAMLVTDLACDLRPIFEAPLDVARGELVGELNIAEKAITLSRLDVEARRMSARLAGAARLELLEDGRWLPSVRLKGEVDGEASHSDVLAFWPVSFADGARDWVSGSVSAARVTDVSIDIDMAAADMAAKRLDEGVLKLGFAFDEASVRFVSTMSALTGARGTALLDGNSFELAMEAGAMAGLDMTEGFV